MASRLRIVLNILLWYLMSVTIILVTKRELSGAGSFPFPLSVTFNSNLVTAIVAFLITRIPHYRPQPLSGDVLMKFVLPIGACVALEISCSNSALKQLDVSFATVLKGASPIFVLLWAVLLRVETFAWRVTVSLLLIFAGIALATAGEGSFAVSGFILMLISVAAGGLRWALTHTLLQDERADRMTPLSAMLYTSPVTGACVLPFAAWLEGMELVQTVMEFSPARRWRLYLILCGIGILVAGLLLTEYVLVRATSSLTVSVAAIFKELVTIVGGVLVYHDPVDLLKVGGFLICQAGILDYVILRYRSHPPTPDEDDEFDYYVALDEMAAQNHGLERTASDVANGQERHDALGNGLERTSLSMDDEELHEVDLKPLNRVPG